MVKEKYIPKIAKQKEKYILKIAKQIKHYLDEQIVLIGRLLAILGIAIIFLSSIGINLLEILKITTPELVVSISLLFFWLSIEIINEINGLMTESSSKLSTIISSQFFIIEKKMSQLSIISTFSSEVDKEIKGKIIDYEKVDIFAYTGQTLFKYLPDPYEYIRDHGKNDTKLIRLLTRGWTIEKECEDKWNVEKRKELENILWKDKKKWDELKWNELKWDKATRMEKDSGSLRTFFMGYTQVKLEQRFYKEAPLFRCYIFGNKEYKEAYIGFYEWQKEPVRGSPYKGLDQPLFHITDETVLGKEMLNIIVSRFEHCWKENMNTAP